MRATGGATNGGFYNASGSSPGTDFSQQDSPAVAVTNAVANGTTTVTSATAAFTSAHNRNGAYIAGSWYEITAVTNATTIVVDRTIAAATGLTLRVGGALDHPATAGASYPSGFTLHVKSGTYLHGTTANASGGRLNITVAGTILGYTATRGDDYPTRPVIQANGSAITLWTISNTGTTYCQVKGIDFYRDTASGLTTVAALSAGQAAIVEDCRARNFNATAASSGAFLTTSTVGPLFRRCQADGGTSGFFASVAGTRLEECVATSPSGIGVNATGNNVTLIRCVVVAPGGSGIVAATAGALLDHCVVHGGSASGIQGGVSTVAIACVATANVANGFLSVGRSIDCAGHGNGTNQDVTSTAGSTGFVAPSADPWANAAGLDFAPNATAGGGAAIRSAARTWPGLAGTSYPDLGAFRHADATATTYYAS